MLWLMSQGDPIEEGKQAARRHQMVTGQLRPAGVRDERVLAAFEDVPRHRFAPPGKEGEAYEDHPVFIGYEQTMSQPLVVAVMVQALDVGEHHRVLDVGAGSGYQTAILARLAKWVYAIERVSALALRAEVALRALGVANVSFRVGDGSLGWPEEAELGKFDRIICGAGGPQIPQSWIDQLAEGGRIVAPIGGADLQQITVLDKRGSMILRKEIMPVRFVKLIGQEGWPETA